MANRGPNWRPPGNDGNGNGMNNFERNKYRQTMPSRFNPISPQNNQNRNNRFNTQSPTQSHVSTVTNYEQPWSSPKFQAPAPANSDEPRFRRTYSMAAKKFDNKQGPEDEKNDRPRINFKEFGKKITNKFKKNNSKNNSDAKKGDRMSVPVMSLGESSAASSSSQPQLKTKTSSPTKKKALVQASSSMKMQPEDRMKMFQKMGREQSMKVSSLQRMQRERQRDFTLVPGPGRNCLETTLNPGSSQSIDSMLVFNNTTATPDSRRSTSLSMTDDDVEPVFKNLLTKKNVTSSQFNSQQKMSGGGPSFTSTPRLMLSTSHGVSPTISNVRSISEASFCMVSEHPIRPDTTMYFSADTLNSSAPRGLPMISSLVQNHPVRTMTDVTMASTASTPTSAPTSSDPPAVPLKRVKEEVVENSPSNCPSFSSSTPSSDLEQQQRTSQVPDNLNNLWVVSKEIRDKQIVLEQAMPKMDELRNRAMHVDQQKLQILEMKGDTPSPEDMRTLWSLCREFVQLNKSMAITSMTIQETQSILPYLEMRRNELLSVSPPPQGAAINPPNFVPGGSFV